LRLRLTPSYNVCNRLLKIGALASPNFGRTLKSANASTHCAAKNSAGCSSTANTTKKIALGISLPLNGKILPELTAAFLSAFRYSFCRTNAKSTTDCILGNAAREKSFLGARQGSHRRDRNTATQNTGFSGSTISNRGASLFRRHRADKFLIDRTRLQSLARKAHDLTIGLVCNAARLKASRRTNRANLTGTLGSHSPGASRTTSANLTNHSRGTTNATT
jgi:hypothetical protein